MDIDSFNCLPSTQHYLVNVIKKKERVAPCAILALEQTDGIGSRENHWEAGEGNLFASIALPLPSLPSDLPLSSLSIYFAYLMKETIENMGQDIWLKWPNDLYYKEAKIGGVITQKVEDTIVFGIGVNLKKSSNKYDALSGEISPKLLLLNYIERLETFPKWKQVFSDFELEFDLSRKFYVHIKEEKKSLKDALLCSDGSLMIDNKKVFSLR